MKKLLYLIFTLSITPYIYLLSSSSFYTLSEPEQKESYRRNVVVPSVRTIELDLIRGIQQKNNDIESYYQQIRDFGDKENYNELISDARKEINKDLKDIQALKNPSLSLSSDTSSRVKNLIEEKEKKFQEMTKIDSDTLKNLKNTNPVTKKFIASPLFSPLEKLFELSRQRGDQLSKQKTNIHEGWGKAWENFKQKARDFFSIKTPSFEKKPTLWQKIQERRPAIKMPRYYAPTWQKTLKRAEKSSIPKYLPQPQKKDSWIKALERQERFGLTR